MIYERKSPQVQAQKIVNVGMLDQYNGQLLELEDGKKVQISAQVLSRCPVNPNPGDYYVVDEAGVPTLASRAVFERQWKKIDDGSGA